MNEPLPPPRPIPIKERLSVLYVEKGQLDVLDGAFVVVDVNGVRTHIPVGGVACLVALALALLHSRHLPNGLVVWAYRGLLLLMLVSVPVGLVLSHIRTAVA